MRNEEFLIPNFLIPNSSLYSINIDISVHHGIDGQCGYAFHPKFFGYVLAVTHHGGQADVEHVGNLLVDMSLCHERQHLKLAVGEGVLLGLSIKRGKVTAVGVGVLFKGEQ